MWRERRQRMTSRDRVRLHDGHLDLNAAVVVHGDCRTRLTPTETALLRCLAHADEDGVADAEILSEVWGYGARVRTRTLTSTVHRIRKKLESDPSKPVHLVRTRDGYRLVAAPQQFASHALEPQTAFFGRDEELALIRAGEFQCLTLIGPGGVGKTRLAMRAITVFEDYAFASIDGAGDAAALDERVAAGLSVTPQTNETLRMALVRTIQLREQLVLVLDNCEVVANVVRAFIDEVVHAAPKVRFLCTSRIAIGMAPEQLLAIGPLTPDQAAAMLKQRASLRRRGWAEGSPAVLAQLVDALDRLPLALELAAARAMLFEPKEILDRTTDRFQILSRPGEGASGGLAGVLERSWEILEPPLRDALCQLCVFYGRFDLRAAEAVVVIEGDLCALDALQMLVERSLVVVDTRDDSREFRLLESIRAWASHRAPDVHGVARGRFVSHYADRCRAVLTDSPYSARTQLGTHCTHIGTAYRLAVEPQDRAWLAIGYLWAARQFCDRGACRDRIRECLPAIDGMSAFHAHLVCIRSQAYPDAPNQALALARSLDQPELAVMVDMEVLARDCARPISEALALVSKARSMNNAWLRERAFGISANQLMMASRPAEAARLYEDSLRLSRQLGSTDSHEVTSVNLAASWSMMGDQVRAAETLTEVINNAPLETHGRTRALAHIQLGRVRYCENRLEDATHHARLAGAEMLRLGDQITTGIAHTDAGNALLDLERTDLAVAAYREARTLFQSIDGHWGSGLADVLEARAELTRGNIDVALTLVTPNLDNPHSVTAGPARGLVATAQAMGGDIEDALKTFQEAREACAHPDSLRAFEILCGIAEAACWVAKDPPRGKAALEAAREAMSAKHHQPGLEACERALAWMPGTDDMPGNSFWNVFVRIVAPR